MDWLSSILQIFEGVHIIRVILGFVLVFFLPGFVWTLVFFKQIKVIERVALSFGLSIAMVPLSIIALHVLLGIRINGLNALLIIIIITVIPVAFYYLKRLITR